MEQFATAKRLNKEHNRKDTPDFGEIKHIIVEKIIHDHKHELIVSLLQTDINLRRDKILISHLYSYISKKFHLSIYV